MKRGYFCPSFLLLASLLMTLPGSARGQGLDSVFDTSARESRMRSVTWDYQPGQAARRLAAGQARTDVPYQPQYQALVNPPIPVQTIKPIPGTTHTYVPVPDPPPEPRSGPADPTSGLRNVTGIELGGQLSRYNYQEPDLEVKNYGYKFGVNALLTGGLYDGWFVRGDLRFAAGDVDYEGSGEQGDQPDYLFELRALGGKDFLFGRFAVAPFTGIGYRYLKNDARGYSSIGSSGYRRESQYLYVPLGFQPRMRLNNGAHLALSVEYDFFVKGWQYSKLTDVYDGYPNMLNQQDNGYGIRGELMYMMSRWSFGPFFNYWNVGTSNYKCGFGSEYVICGVEPMNQTVEWGAQFRYKLY